MTRGDEYWRYTLKPWINKNFGSYEVEGNFEEFASGRKAQDARYLYLMMCYEVAKGSRDAS
jgi:hypothetical protein